MKDYVKKVAERPVIIHGRYLPKNAIYGNIRCLLTCQKWTNDTSGRHFVKTWNVEKFVQFYCDDFRYAPCGSPAYYIHVFDERAEKWRETNTLSNSGYSAIFDAVDDFISAHNLYDVPIIPCVHHNDCPVLRQPKADDVRKQPNLPYALNSAITTETDRITETYVPKYVGDPLLRRKNAAEYRKKIGM